MTKNRKARRSKLSDAVVIAVITVVGTIAAALISNWRELRPTNVSQPLPSTVRTDSVLLDLSQGQRGWEQFTAMIRQSTVSFAESDSIAPEEIVPPRGRVIILPLPLKEHLSSA